MSKPVNLHDGGGIALTNETGQVIVGYGTTVPTDGAANYVTGALFVHTDGAAGTAAYLNEGTAAAADFNAVTSAAGTGFVEVAGDTMTGSLVMTDAVALKLGTDGDVNLYHKATATNANTVVTGVVIGTPVTPALAANSTIISNVTADGDFLVATQTGGNSQAAIFVDGSAGTVGLYAAGVVKAIVSSAGLTLGVAGTSTGKLLMTGATSGTITITGAAAAGTWTFTLPADDGDAGEQLQTDGNGVSTWEAAGSMRAVKEVVGVLDDKAREALDRILGRSVYAFHYKPNARQEAKLPALSDTKTEFHGVMADEYPEVMMWGGKIFSPISAFGEAMLAIKALAAEVTDLKSKLAAE